MTNIIELTTRYVSAIYGLGLVSSEFMGRYGNSAYEADAIEDEADRISAWNDIAYAVIGISALPPAARFRDDTLNELYNAIVDYLYDIGYQSKKKEISDNSEIFFSYLEFSENSLFYTVVPYYCQTIL